MKISGSALGKAEAPERPATPEAQSERAKARRGSEGVCFSPVAVAMTMGKTQRRKLTRIFGPGPKPIQRSRIGAIAIFGTAFRPSRIG